MRALELFLGCGWVFTTLLVFGMLLRGRAVQAGLDEKPRGSLVILGILSVAAGAMWLPLLLTIGVRWVIRRRPLEGAELAGHLDARGLDQRARTRLKENAEREVEKLRAQAKPARPARRGAS